VSDYFSDRENGPRARTVQEIDPVTWAGLAALITGRVSQGAFGKAYPLVCPDGNEVFGTEESGFAAALRAEINGLQWPLVTSSRDDGDFMSEWRPSSPPTLQVLDTLEFCWRHIAKTYENGRHDYFKHTHLRFEVEPGRDEFRDDANRILARNGMAYEMQPDGRFVRLAPPVLAELLRAGVLRTGDRILDVMLEEVRVKFMSPEPLTRREALERLFDSFERLKSIAHADKATSIRMLLERAAPEPSFRASLDAECKELTSIGNGNLFRHHEVRQNVLVDVQQVDYVFHRLYAIVALLVRASLSGTSR
jgi:hypothetical protein